MIPVWLLFYASFFLWLCLRLNDIRRNPRKYNLIPGFEEYKRSPWYWPPKKIINNLDPVSGCTEAASPLEILFMLFFLITWVLSLLWARPGLPMDKTTAHFSVSSVGGCFAAMLFLFFYSILLGNYFIMFSRKPKAICYSLHRIFRKDDRSIAWRKMTAIVLAATVIVCPIHLLCLASSGYADSEKIIVRPYGSSEDIVLYYKDIAHVEKEYDENGNEIHCYLIGSDGVKIDIASIGDVKNWDRDVESEILAWIPADKLT